MTTTDVTSALEKIRDAQALQRRIVQDLLDDQLHDETRVLVTAGRMGVTTSYVGTVSFRWIDRNVKIFTQLDLIRNRLDDRGQFVLDNESIDELQQRAPDWSRQAVLVHYLLRNRARKFPAMLLVVSEAWVNDPAAPEWNAEGRATKASVPFARLDGQGRVGLVELRRGVTVYVVDGQHRLMGIQGLLELLRTGHLDLRAANRKPTGVESLEQLKVSLGLTDADIASVEDETMGVEFIPAVMQGETREDARRRVRSTFVHVNKTARPLTHGELAALDEEDGFAIVARTIARQHPLFKKEESGDRVSLKTTALPDRSKWLTALATLTDMARGYLGAAAPFRAWVPRRKDELATRPDETELEDATRRFREFWDGVASLPSFASIQKGEATIDEWRQFPTRAKGKSVGHGHLLMRPVGQSILADAVGKLHRNGQGVPLADLVSRLRRLDEAHLFDRVDAPTSPWYGVVYDPVGQRIVLSGRDAGVLILTHLLGGESALTPAERARLLEQYRKLRTVPGENGAALYWNASGDRVASPDAIELPRAPEGTA
ncbi:DGQHR domain-containing protein [Deinococcus yavapaiensis]|uniref:DGQHR domain-containing protein n=1 Tax=Deinococcus yavapaiensis KR-236 TaxID=694435 RepID=A0A318S8C1_9DEIO|nr:DGQHR domain-containing protein [Deinococcus yavapaiensis]PYE54086.1 DGQHR domain-containing protein [Deinococcus yavapaiensis KR-236]